MLRFGRALMLIAVLLTSGGHWAVLQSLAWANMLADGLRTLPLREAVQRTFDGAHPCEMCMRIHSGRKSEEQQKAVLRNVRFDFPMPAETTKPRVPVRPAEDLQAPATTASAIGQPRQEPPVPPPQPVTA